jgi:hypothetical protein
MMVSCSARHAWAPFSGNVTSANNGKKHWMRFSIRSRPTRLEGGGSNRVRYRRFKYQSLIDDIICSPVVWRAGCSHERNRLREISQPFT